MINIIGQNPSANTLRAALVGREGIGAVNIDVCFGARKHTNANNIVLNGQGRVDAQGQLTKFQEAGLLVPTWTSDLELAKTWVREGRLVWGRRWIHTQGQDIIGSGYRLPRLVRASRIKDRIRPESFNQAWLQREWWVQVIPADAIANEWRIHIFQGRSIGRGLKVQTGESTRVQPVRNRNNGWTLRHDVEPSHDVRLTASRAVQSINYNFGAVDLIELKDSRIVVLEVNSAPALRSDYTLNVYTEAITRMSQGKYTNWKEPKVT